MTKFLVGIDLGDWGALDVCKHFQKCLIRHRLYSCKQQKGASVEQDQSVQEKPCMYETAGNFFLTMLVVIGVICVVVLSTT